MQGIFTTTVVVIYLVLCPTNSSKASYPKPSDFFGCRRNGGSTEVLTEIRLWKQEADLSPRSGGDAGAFEQMEGFFLLLFFGFCWVLFCFLFFRFRCVFFVFGM